MHPKPVDYVQTAENFITTSAEALSIFFTSESKNYFQSHIFTRDIYHSVSSVFAPQTTGLE